MLECTDFVIWGQTTLFSFLISQSLKIRKTENATYKNFRSISL